MIGQSSIEIQFRCTKKWKKDFLRWKLWLINFLIILDVHNLINFILLNLPIRKLSDVHNLSNLNLLNFPIRKLSDLLSHEFEVSGAGYSSVEPIQQSGSVHIPLLRSSKSGRRKHPSGSTDRRTGLNLTTLMFTNPKS